MRPLALRAASLLGGALLVGGAATAQLDFTSVGGTSGFAGTLTAGFGQHAGGAAWIDYNGDFLPDLFVSNGQGLAHYLFRNEGDGTFSDVSSLVPKTDLSLEEVGCLFGDVDNDGDSDLLVIVDDPEVLTDVPPEGGPNLFYRNDGGAFVEVAASNGVRDPLGRRNVCGGFADYDRDGWLDLFLGRWQPTNPDGLVSYDRMLRNDGSGVFVDDSGPTRVDGYGRSALACVWTDADGDLWPDLYVGNAGRSLDGVEEPSNNDVLYGNFNEGVRFCDCTGDPHVVGDDAKLPRGITTGDVDNDGDMDLYLSDNVLEGPAPFGNVLYLATGDGRYAENACLAAEVCSLDSWGTGFVDFDRDGWLDLWVGTTNNAVPDRIYQNDQDGTFTEVLLVALLDNRNRGGSHADYDGDGDVDLVLVNQNQEIRLLRNDSVNTNNWLSVRLLGVTSNRDAIGARVRVTAGGVTQTRYVSGGDGAHSQPELMVHFGLGGSASCDVQVDWPNGATQDFPGVSSGQVLFVEEGVGVLAEALPTTSATWSTGLQTLTVVAKSTYGGRTSLTVSGIGPLTYDASQTTWAGTFGGVTSDPGTVTITSTSGGSFVVDTTVVP